MTRWFIQLREFWRALLAAAPCPETSSGLHDWVHETQGTTWRLRCCECGRTSHGWRAIGSRRTDW